MLLALDVGNTNITIGAFDGKTLVGPLAAAHHPRTDRGRMGHPVRNLFTLAGLDLAAVDGVMISSVVPGRGSAAGSDAERYFQRQPMFVNSSTDLGIVVHYDNPREVGADRLVNAVAG